MDAQTMDIIIDKVNKTINNQDPIAFINDWIDGKEDYYVDQESDFIDTISDVVYDSDSGDYTYKNKTYDQAYKVIYSDADLVIQWFEYMFNNELL
jgi:hypothetical protein